MTVALGKAALIRAARTYLVVVIPALIALVTSWSTGGGAFDAAKAYQALIAIAVSGVPAVLSYILTLVKPVTPEVNPAGDPPTPGK